MKLCYKCGNEWAGVGQPGTKETCGKCSADIHVCLNCRFYDQHKPQECSVDVPETVRDKERFNYCEEFQFNDRRSLKVNPERSRKIDDGSGNTRDAFNKLFKK